MYVVRAEPGFAATSSARTTRRTAATTSAGAAAAGAGATARTGMSGTPTAASTALGSKPASM